MEKLDEIQINFNNDCLKLKKKHDLEQKNIMNQINSLKKYFKFNLLNITIISSLYPVFLINFGIIIPTIIFGTIYGYLSYDSYRIFKSVRSLRKENMEYHLKFTNELNTLQTEFNNKINDKQKINVINYNYSINKKMVLKKTKK